MHYNYDGKIWEYNPKSECLVRDNMGSLESIKVDQWDDGLPKIGSAYGLPCNLGGSVLPRQQASVWDTQVGGNHYTKMKIQPLQFSMANKLDPMQHTIIKYVTRFRDKNGIQDLEKAKQTIDLLIAYEKEQQCN